MELLEINSNGTATYQLSDGRQLKSYKSGYVRISNYHLDRLYQINKKVKTKDEYWTGVWHGRGRTDVTIYTYTRILIPNELERLEFIVNWVKRNIGK